MKSTSCRTGLPAALLACLLLVVLTPASAAAQDSIAHGTIAGRVTDESGAVLRNSVVVARHLETGVLTTAATDDAGRFRLPSLRIGPYEVSVHAPGFAVGARTLRLDAGAAFDLPIALALARLESEITVAAQAEVLEAARSQVTATIRRSDVQSLPLNGRNLLDVPLVAPGVAPPNVGGGTQLFPETSAVPGVSLSVSGQRNLSNNFVVDGLSANDDAAALSGMSFGTDAVETVQVVTSGGQAELGRALGGHINVVTRSGTNTPVVEAYAYVSDDRFSAPNALSGRTLPMDLGLYGASAGGPISRNRTFFFGNIETKRLDQSGLVRIPQTTVDVINARLTETGYGGPAVSTGIYPNPIDTMHALLKLDHHAAAGGHVSVRYSAYSASSEHARGAGGLAAPSAAAGLDNLDQALAMTHVLVRPSGTVLETRAQFARGDLEADPADPVGPAVSIAGVASFGRLSTSPTGRLSRTVQVATTLSRQAGPHAVRAGIDVLHNDVHIDFPRATRGSYSFSSLAAFLAGTYNNSGFSQTFGDTAVSMSNPNIGFYAQDEWKAGARLTLNAGLRYDLQGLETIRTDTNNLSPRLGVVWVPGEARRFLLRASAGRFYDRVPLRALANALLSAGNTTDLDALRQVSVSLSPGQVDAPSFPARLEALVPSTTRVNLTTMDRDIQNARSDQISVEMERELGRSGTISIGYERLRGRGLIMQINRNVPSCPATADNNGCRPNPDYANHNEYSSAGSSDYDAMHVSIVDRPSAWSSYRVSYTLARSMNNVGETFFASPIDPSDLSKDWGPSDSDRRHTLVVLGTLSTPAGPARTRWALITNGFTVNALWQWYSALPFNITTGTNTLQGTRARPTVNGAFIPRNAGRGTSFSNVNLRVSRGVSIGKARLDGLVEMFNLLNTRNDLARNTTFGTGPYPTNPIPTFGEVTAVGEPRSIQFGIRVKY